MKDDSISLRRRHLMIAGAVTIATPATAFSVQSTYVTDAGAAKLVISGRVLGPDGKPLAGAAVDANNLPGVRATTDADGRFVFTTVAGTVRNGRPQPLTCSVSHPAHRTLENTLEFGRAGIQRDEAGGWRAAIGLHLA